MARITFKPKKKNVCWIEWLFNDPRARATRADKYKAYHLVTKRMLKRPNSQKDLDNITKELLYRCRYVEEFHRGKPDARHAHWMKALASKITEDDVMKLSLADYARIKRFR